MLSTCFLQEASAEPASSSGLGAGSAVGSALALAVADLVFPLAGAASAEPEVSASATSNSEARNAERIPERIARSRPRDTRNFAEKREASWRGACLPEHGERSLTRRPPMVC